MEPFELKPFELKTRIGVKEFLRSFSKENIYDCDHDYYKIGNPGCIMYSVFYSNDLGCRFRADVYARIDEGKISRICIVTTDYDGYCYDAQHRKE